MPLHIADCYCWTTVCQNSFSNRLSNLEKLRVNGGWVYTSVRGVARILEKGVLIEVVQGCFAPVY